MLESTVNLLGDVFLAALTLLIGSCVVGSIIVALRAIHHGSAIVTRKEVNEVCELAGATRMAALTTYATEPKPSEEMQYGWRRAQELERIGQRRARSKRSR